MMDEKIAAQLSKQILPPLIGIGSGDHCDGQILVTHDLLGLTPSPLPSLFTLAATLGLDGLKCFVQLCSKGKESFVVKKMNFCLRAGAWGTAVSVYLSKLGHSVSLIPRRVEHALALASDRENKDYLPGILF